jgi:hypothetical protein
MVLTNFLIDRVVVSSIHLEMVRVLDPQRRNLHRPEHLGFTRAVLLLGPMAGQLVRALRRGATDTHSAHLPYSVISSASRRFRYYFAILGAITDS